MTDFFDVTLEDLIKADQLQLLTFFDTIEVPSETFLEYLAGFDYYEINKIYKKATTNSKKSDLKKFRSVSSLDVATIKNRSELLTKTYTNLGLSALANAQLCFLLFHDETCPVHLTGKSKLGLPSGKSLYQIHAERILAIQKYLQQKFKQYVEFKWLIMVTLLTKSDHLAYFQRHNYFGLSKSNVIFIEQDVVPCFNSHGKILLEEKHRIALTSNGSGGIFSSLLYDKILELMDDFNIKYMYAFGLSNFCVKLFDPVFIGYCIDRVADCGIKVMERKPEDTMAVLGKIDNDYYAIPVEDVINCPVKPVKFRYSDAYTYLFDVEFLSRVLNEHLDDIQYKAKNTSIPYQLNTGNLSSVNGVIVKKYIGDAIRFAKKLAFWEIDRDNEFLQIELLDDKIVGSVLDKYYKIQRDYIIKAGGVVEGKEIEISQLIPDLETLEELVKGKVFKAPAFVQMTGEETYVPLKPQASRVPFSKIGKSLVSLIRTSSTNTLSGAQRSNSHSSVSNKNN